MIRTIHIETITPVHIGSGNLLTPNTDFIARRNKAGEIFIRILDDKKILQLIGQENIHHWISCIERKEDCAEMVKLYAPTSRLDDFTSRRMQLFGEMMSPNDTLKETLHDGMGRPYIPGSSIKGAIRTAILSELAREEKELERQSVNRKGRPDAAAIEKKLFGADAKSDIFRFLQIGDAYFEHATEIALKLEMKLNVSHKESVECSGQKPQLAETIGACATSSLRMKIDDILYRQCKSIMNYGLRNMPLSLSSEAHLFKTINSHTINLLQTEIDIWENYDDADIYINNIKDILRTAKACNENSCVLRIGHASGWRFITGAWTEELKNFKSDIINACRPQNWRYEEYMFPKSRRADSDGQLIGFVKLSL